MSKTQSLLVVFALTAFSFCLYGLINLIPVQAETPTILTVLREVQTQQAGDSDMWVGFYTRPVGYDKPSDIFGRITHLSDALVCVVNSYSHEYCLPTSEIVYFYTTKPINANR